MNPQVDLWDPVIRAVEVMLRHDLQMIAVNGRGRLVGHIRLSEALNCLGLRRSVQLHPGLTQAKTRQQKDG